LRGTPGSAYPQPEPNATELPSSAPGRPKLIKLHASAPSPTPTRAEEHIATTPDCRLRALARRRAPKRTSHYTCWCERNTLRETLGALATWVPATAMLPLPLAFSWSARNLGARNRDAAVAASSFIVTHIVVATAQFLIVRAATKRRYRRCCPLLWRCGLLRSRRCAVVTSARSSLVPQHSLVRGTYKTLRRGLSNLRRTRLPCSSPQRLARRGTHASPFSNPTSTGC